MTAVSRGTAHVTTKQRCKFNTTVDIQNALCKAAIVHSEPHVTIKRSESARKQRIVLYRNRSINTKHVSCVYCEYQVER